MKYVRNTRSPLRMNALWPCHSFTPKSVSKLSVMVYHGIFQPIRAFIREGERVFRTYFINNRGDEAMGSTWSYLDLTALGRQEEWEDSPEGYPQTPRYKWWNWHDNYDAEASPDAKWVEVSEAGEAAFREPEKDAKA